jgi:hypothetical protein
MIALFAAASPARAGDWSAQLVVMPFHASGVVPEVVLAAETALARQLVEQGTMRIVAAAETRQHLDGLGTPLLEKCFDPECARDLGLLLDAPLVLLGTLEKSGAGLVLTCALFDTRARRRLGLGSASFSGARGVGAAVTRVMDELWHRDTTTEPAATARPKPAAAPRHVEARVAENAPIDGVTIAGIVGIALAAVALGTGVYLWSEEHRAGPVLAGAGLAVGGGLTIALALRF